WLEALFAWRALLDGAHDQDEDGSAEARAAIGALRRLTRGMDPAQAQGSSADPILEALRQARP
ncbi:MAG: hypothetical protein GXP55_07305, partial [Deltaproteobacteria bacterium]|nr:hypothetical protein [Deltaproteobacteria bacterium]